MEPSLNPFPRTPTREGVSNPFATFNLPQYNKRLAASMPIAHIPNDAADSTCFITPTVWRWYYIFDRHDRWQILADSLQFLQQRRGLEIYGFVFMLNHLHLLIRAPDVTACVRDFKRHTSRQIHKSLRRYEPSVLPLFVDETGHFRLWKPDNKPKLVETERFFLQKLNYIHENPVRKGYVEFPEHWKWSSANPHCPLEIANIW